MSSIIEISKFSLKQFNACFSLYLLVGSITTENTVITHNNLTIGYVLKTYIFLYWLILENKSIINIACSNETYGPGCLFNCSGNCINGEPCDKKTGHCTACVDGYIGEQCNISRSFTQTFW